MTFQAVNPATGDDLQPNYVEATTDEVDQAFRKVEVAFNMFRKKALMKERSACWSFDQF